MRYLETRPSTDLSPYVHCVWELQGGSTALAEPIFPDGRIEIIVHLGDRPVLANDSTPQADVIVAGQLTSAVRLGSVSRLHAVGIRFTPCGARAWLAAPLHELTDFIGSLDDVSHRITTRLRDAVHGGATPSERVRRIESVMRATLVETWRAPRSVEEAVHLTLATCGRAGVDALARRSGITTRHLERQYLDVVGLPPKTFARTVRFQRALRELQRGTSAASAAISSGFADQSHLAREFRRFAGVAAGCVRIADVAFLQDSGSPRTSD